MTPHPALWSAPPVYGASHDSVRIDSRRRVVPGDSRSRFIRSMKPRRDKSLFATVTEERAWSDHYLPSYCLR